MKIWRETLKNRTEKISRYRPNFLPSFLPSFLRSFLPSFLPPFPRLWQNCFSRRRLRLCPSDGENRRNVESEAFYAISKFVKFSLWTGVDLAFRHFLFRPQMYPQRLTKVRPRWPFQWPFQWPTPPPKKKSQWTSFCSYLKPSVVNLLSFNFFFFVCVCVCLVDFCQDQGVRK